MRTYALLIGLTIWYGWVMNEFEAVLVREEGEEGFGWQREGFGDKDEEPLS